MAVVTDNSVGNVLIMPVEVILLALFRMDPQLPETFNHRTEKLATGRVYHFVRFLKLFYLPRVCLNNFVG
jgi:hypothetical protein